MLPFTLPDALAHLRRTPAVLRAWLAGLPDAWLYATEGPETWSPFDVVGHLLHGERTDWLPRVEHILAGNADVPFTPFDRFAMFEESRGKTLEELLAAFERLRAENLTRLEALAISEADLDRRGLHPSLGPVTLRQLLATWVVHDLSHLGQIARVMAKQYREEIGPWVEYHPLLAR